MLKAFLNIQKILKRIILSKMKCFEHRTLSLLFLDCKIEVLISYWTFETISNMLGENRVKNAPLVSLPKFPFCMTCCNAAFHSVVEIEK